MHRRLSLAPRGAALACPGITTEPGASALWAENKGTMSMWRFTDGSHDPAQAFPGSYDPGLVLLSFLVAAMAAYAALSVATRIGALETRKARWGWLGAGALAMGVGIWAMHFIAMLAYSLPTLVTYDLSLTLVSMIPALIGSGLALAVLSRSELHPGRLWGGAFLMAAAIGAMHYTGMEAMETGAALRYDPWLFLASFVVAHFLAMLALSTKFALGRCRHPDRLGLRVAGAALMGGAVAAMHYTGMSAAYFFPDPGAVPAGAPVDTTLMVAMISIVTILVVGIAVFGSMLDNSRLQMMQAVESNPSGFAYYRDGHLVVANAVMKDLFPELAGLLVPGTPYARIVRRWARSWGTLPDGVGAEAYIAARCDPFPGMRFRYEARLPDGRIAAVEEHGTEQGGLVSVWHDITELKAAQQRLIQSEKMASLGQMVGGVAHEINTPLGYVRSNVTIVGDLIGEAERMLTEYRRLLQLIQSSEAGEAEVAEQLRKVEQLASDLAGEDPVAESRELLSDALQGLDEISQLVVNLRDFCRVDKDQMDRFDVNQGLEKTLSIAHNNLKYHAEVVRDFGEVPAITASPTQVNQVFLNLVNNAAQALEGEGRIWLATRADAETVTVSIRDEGRGIPEEARARIFDPFFTTKDVGEGTGMGLAIAYRILEQHEADIQVASTPGQGTEFTIRFPIRTGDREPMPKTA